MRTSCRCARHPTELHRDQQNAVTIAQFAQACEKSIGGNEIAPLPLDGSTRMAALRSLARCARTGRPRYNEAPRVPVTACEQRPIVVRVRNMRDSRHRREETFLLRVLARRERQRPHRSAVKPPRKPRKAAAARHVARQLERRLDALCTRLREETHHRLLHRRELIDPLAQADLAFVPVVRRYMQEAIRRILDGCTTFGWLCPVLQTAMPAAKSKKRFRRRPRLRPPCRATSRRGSPGDRTARPPTHRGPVVLEPWAPAARF